MLILAKPHDTSKYISVDDFHLNLYLLKRGYHPKYRYDNLFYYNKNKNIEREIKVYNVLDKESEGSGLEKNL